MSAGTRADRGSGWVASLLRPRGVPADLSEASAIRLDRQSVLPAALAAAGEAAVLFLPLRALAMDGTDATAGPMVSYTVFALLFTGAVALSTALRRFKELPSVIVGAAVALGIAQSLAWGSGTSLSMASGVVLALVLGLRVAMLALRDWRDPIRFSFGLGVAALLVEVVIATGGTAGWRPFLPPLIAQFFLGTLASRAASVRPSARPAREAADDSEPRRWLRTTVALVGGVGLLLFLAALMGREGGILQWVGTGVFRLVTGFIGLVAFALAKVLIRPLNWVVTSLHLSLNPFSRLAQNLEGFQAGPRRAGTGHGGALNRFLGLLFFVLFGVLLVRTLRRRRELVERYQPSELQVPEERTTPFAMIRSRRHLRRQGPTLPADTVRRWYAQALLALERSGVPKPPADTPAEYLRDVISSLPACAAEFTVLTRAYEDVRYGNRRLDQRDIDRLDPHRVLLMETIRSGPTEAPGSQVTDGTAGPGRVGGRQ